MIDATDLQLLRFANSAEDLWREVSAGVLAAEGGARP